MKTSPRGLFKIETANDREKIAASVERYIADSEAWARSVLDAAGIKVESRDIVEMAERRPYADGAHGALITLHQATMLRGILKRAKLQDHKSSWQAVISAYHMAQLLYAAFQGTLSLIEPLIDSGRRSKFAGEDSGKTRREWLPLKDVRIKRLFQAERARGKGKMQAYKNVARLADISIATVRNVVNKKHC